MLCLKTVKSLAMYSFCKDGGNYTDVHTVLCSFFQLTDTRQLAQFQVLQFLICIFFKSKSWNNDIVETCARIFSVR